MSRDKYFFVYSSKPNLLIGFHGCEEVDQQRLITNISYFKKSEEDYDWLGHGMYFWEGNEKRAWQWTQQKKKAGTLKNPAVVGAVCDLGRCFDLLDSTNISTLKKYMIFLSKIPKKQVMIYHKTKNILVVKVIGC